MSVLISIPTPLRRYAGGKNEVLVDAATAADALQQLASEHNELRQHLFTDQNTLRNFVNIYVNDDDVRHGGGLNMALKDGDTITIVPAIAGGSAIR